MRTLDQNMGIVVSLKEELLNSESYIDALKDIEYKNEQRKRYQQDQIELNDLNKVNFVIDGTTGELIIYQEVTDWRYIHFAKKLSDCEMKCNQGYLQAYTYDNQTTELLSGSVDMDFMFVYRDAILKKKLKN